MRNLFNKINKEDIKTSLVKGVSKSLGAVHFVAQSSADLVKEAEVKLITSTKRYDADMVRRLRTYKTIKRQQNIKDAYSKTSKMLREAKERAQADVNYQMEKASKSSANFLRFKERTQVQPQTQS